MNLCEALKRLIELAGGNHKKYIDDSYLSSYHFYKMQKLEKILAQLEAGASIDRILSELQKERLHLRQVGKEEAFHPTFDWYGEHHWEIVYEGEADGCKEAIEVLEQFASDSLGVTSCYNSQVNGN